jgi:hypothetical protein
MAHLKSDRTVRVARRRVARRGLIGWLWRVWYDGGAADYRTGRAVRGGPARSYSTPDSYCSRCLREAPRALWDPAVAADDPSLRDPRIAEWEVTPNDEGPNRMLCPDCVASEEEEWAKADAVEFEQWKRGEGRS